jgi:hypothetical protein
MVIFAEGDKKTVKCVGIDKEEFMSWKTEISATVAGSLHSDTLRSTPRQSAETDIIEKVKNFDLSNASPMERLFIFKRLFHFTGNG